MTCRSLRVYFAVLLSFTFLAIAPQLRAETSKLIVAPLNPNFLNYQKSLTVHQSSSSASGGHALGFIAAPVDLSRIQNQFRGTMSPSHALPLNYDLRTASPARLTPVKNQGTAPVCWTFGTYASLESCLLPGETWDFSENNLKNTSGFDSGLVGGNFLMSTAYLTRWSGPIAEADDPYNPLSAVSPGGLMPEKHVQEAMILPPRYVPTDNAAIKNAIINYGAVGVSMTWDDTAYKAANYAYNYDGFDPANHVVAIVGWNDKFSKSKFQTIPDGDGAFIVKNSWGSGWGEGGYFYVSYYDTMFAVSGSTVFLNAEPTDNYSYVYQYDPLGMINTSGFMSNEAWEANVFTAERTERLAAIGFYTTDSNTLYEISVYLDPVSGGPLSGGTLIGSMSGQFVNAGFHTAKFPATLPLTSGHKFSVVIKLTNPSEEFPIAIEYAVAGYSSGANSSPGQSFISSDGINWSDISANSDSPTNVCIKAYTVSLTPPLINDFSPAESTVGSSVIITGSSFTGATGVQFYNTSATSFTVDSDTQITAVVPAGATTGPIRVTNPQGIAVSESYFVVTPLHPPVISNFTPTGGNPGETVTISGSYFSSTTAVSFNGTPAADHTIDNDTQITAVVPATATTGPISVTNYDGTSVSSEIFSVNVAPVAYSGNLAAVAGIARTGQLAADDADDSDLTYAIVSGPGKGTVSITNSATGAFRYTANLGVTGMDSFTYHVTDPHGLVSNDATISVSIVPPISAVTLAGNPVSPTITDAHVTLTAAVTGGAAPEYQFWVKAPGSTAKTLLREYSAARTCPWTPTITGTYILLVYVREQGSSAALQAYWAISYIVNSPLSGLKLTGNPSSPFKTGAAVTLTATPTGGGTPEYQFWVLNPGDSDYTLLRDYRTVKTCSWTPAVEGTYTLQVFAREIGSSDVYQVEKSITYVVKPPLTGISFTASAPSETATGMNIILTAIPTGGALPQYQFWVKNPGMTEKTLLRDYSATSTCVWTPTEVGSYTLLAYARDKGSGAPYQFYQVLTFNVLSPMTGVTLTGSPASPTVTNTLINLTATPTGGGTPEYQFWVRVPGSAAKTLLRDYSTVNTCTLLTTVPGTYTVLMYAREKGSPAAYQYYQTLIYSVAAKTALTSVYLAANPSSGHAVAGTHVTLTATPTGGGSCEYQFWMTTPGTSDKTLLRDYSIDQTCPWTPAMAGVHILEVYARDYGSTEAYGVTQSLSFTVNPPLSAVSLSANPPSPGTVGTGVLLTGTPTDGGMPEYQFWVKNPGAPAKSLLREYGEDNTCPWTPSTVGTYILYVYVREQGSTAAYQVYQVITYTAQ